MPESPMTDAHKRALIVAYYLSKFDRKGVRALGFATFDEAKEKLGAALGVKSSTIKHMRDSFDPYCSQVRVGWYQRKILPSRANVIQAYDDLSEAAMAEVVKQLLTGNEQATQAYTAPIAATNETLDALLAEDNPFANRLRTGERAETYFLECYPHLAEFQGSNLDDTRRLGIGFDFRVNFPVSYLAVEVKGVMEAHGSISFTDKEWAVAKMLEQHYILALVRSLNHTPILELVPNPANYLTATMRTVESVSVCWNANV